jgi:YesN/AraC family two-component response regulator
MEEEKIYMDENLSLYDLANKLGIHKNYLSYIINDSLDSNFYTLINRHRIEEAKKMLKDEKI